MFTCPTTNSESSCYSISQIAESNAPLLPSVTAAVILTMNTATERHASLSADDNVIKNLCPSLFMQCNLGFKKCHKQGVSNTSHDLIHAYLNVFREMRHHKNLLIIEDDAQFDITDLATHLKRVDEFIESNDFSIYTLGSLALLMIPIGWNHHRRIVGRWASTQAVIWSHRIRDEILQTMHLERIPRGTIKHMDNILGSNDDVYTYYKPIATQLFPATENQENWCFNCTRMNEPHRKKQENIYRHLTRALFSLFGMDKHSRPGWDLVYFGGFGFMPLLFISIISIILIIIVVKCRNRQQVIIEPLSHRTIKL